MFVKGVVNNYGDRGYKMEKIAVQKLVVPPWAPMLKLPQNVVCLHFIN